MSFTELEGWLSVAGAARVLNMSRQAVHSRISRGNTFSDGGVRVVSTGNEARPFFLIAESEVLELAKSLSSEQGVSSTL